MAPKTEGAQGINSDRSVSDARAKKQPTLEKKNKGH